MQAQSIIDYSLLLGKLNISAEELKAKCAKEPKRGLYIDADGQPWCVGIIDPLTGFTLQKKAEYLLKQIKEGGGT